MPRVNAVPILDKFRQNRGRGRSWSVQENSFLFFSIPVTPTMETKTNTCLIPGSGSGWSGSSDIAKLTLARIKARCDAKGEPSLCTEQVSSKSGKREKLVSLRAAHKKNDYLALAKPIDYSTDMLTRNGEPNNLHLPSTYSSKECYCACFIVLSVL